MGASMEQVGLCNNEIKSILIRLWSHPDSAATMSGGVTAVTGGLVHSPQAHVQGSAFPRLQWFCESLFKTAIDSVYTKQLDKSVSSINELQITRKSGNKSNCLIQQAEYKENSLPARLEWFHH